jgi:succinate dehydrogenase flavin-adding protein (antitoxin of CptAB toxin-antitoxin module)
LCDSDRLEVDLLMGSFAARHVYDMSEEDLRQYEDILNEETIDIFNLITGKIELPEVRSACADAMIISLHFCSI